VIILYALLRIFGYVISLIPYRVIYILSDFAAFILGRVINYRKDVIDKNLHIAFKDMGIEERTILKKKFYQNFCDVFLEALKLLSMKESLIAKRITFANHEIFEKLYLNNRNPVVLMGHNCNWEWVGTYLPKASKYKVLAVYKPLSNLVFDRFMLKIRGMYGTKLIPVKETFKAIKGESDRFLLLLIGDQAPRLEGAHIVNFFGLPTPFYTGASKISKMLSSPVVFVNMERLSRGHYVLTAKLLIDEPLEYSEVEITQRYALELEQQICKNPSDWLWSHNRWKHNTI